MAQYTFQFVMSVTVRSGSYHKVLSYDAWKKLVRLLIELVRPVKGI